MKEAVILQLKLAVQDAFSDVLLYTVAVNCDGEWVYQSRAMEEATGKLSPAELAQLKSLYEAVDWGKEIVNAPIGMNDHTLFRLEVDHGKGNAETYRFSDIMANMSWQMRDLIHYLRHNLAHGGDPVGFVTNGNQFQPEVRP